LTSVLSDIKPGIKEVDIALALELEMRRRGAEGKAFDFIVASGERGAMPHGRASEKIIQSGDLITIDFGALKDGYHSDETVTVACGKPEKRAREIHAIVRTAHDLAINAVRPGISCKDLDEVARSYIRDNGYGDYFGHGLGHGIGLEIHEMPTLSPRSTAVLEEGMVITIEPGIYIPGFGGVRIEDTVVVTVDGCDVITSADKQLLVL
jgi:Xaa-Pro aminopeptidase